MPVSLFWNHHRPRRRQRRKGVRRQMYRICRLTPLFLFNPISIRMFIEFLALGIENVGERHRTWPNRTFQLLSEMLISVLRQFCHVDDNAFAFHRISFTPADYKGGHSLGSRLSTGGAHVDTDKLSEEKRNQGRQHADPLRAFHAVRDCLRQTSFGYHA